MNIRETSTCGLLIDYLAGEVSEVDRKRFERHMQECRPCREDVEAWGCLWDSQTDGTKLLEPPPDLKDEVLGGLFPQPRPHAPHAAGRRSALSRTLRYVTIAALFGLVFVAGTLWRDWSPSSQAAALPSEIESWMPLTAQKQSGWFEDHPDAYGVACVVKAQLREQLVVYVFDTPSTSGSQAYQVWLWEGDRRRSAGTFTVGESGIGVLSVPWTFDPSRIEQIGVTLEPQSSGSEMPSGPAVFDGEVRYETYAKT